jgi:AraC family transcriptional regulator of adaptative response/methylated-DNA-[protein]-cysteine methyltransferase
MQPLQWSAHESSLGHFYLVVSERGIAALNFAEEGDEADRLPQSVRTQFPQIELCYTTRCEWSFSIRGFVEKPSQELDLPLDLVGSEFQLSVWTRLRDIPLGETRSYKQIAIELGRPTATRAVARAIATNPVSILIPCHRVIGSDGTLTGYRWGLWRKEELLARERAEAPNRA